MNQEPTIKPINEDDNTPATKGDVATVAKDVATVAQDLEDLAEATHKGFEQTATKQDVERILNEFKVVAENIHRDVAGANKDEITALTQQVPDHEDRLVDLEKKVGVTPGPRYEHV